MTGGAERGHVIRSEVLHLVDEHRDPAPDVGSQAPHVGEQLDQVDLDVARVGPTTDRRCVDAGVPDLAQLRGWRGVTLREGADHAEDVVDLVRRRMAELSHGLVQGTRQRPPQPLVGSRFELAGAPAASYGRGTQRVEQHRLADPPQTGQHQRAFGTTLRHPLEHDVEGGQLLVTTGELRRALACSGRIGIANRVHDLTVSTCLAWIVDFKRVAVAAVNSASG